VPQLRVRRGQARGPVRAVRLPLVPAPAALVAVVVVLVTGDKALRWSTIAAVSAVALVAGFVSYRHALQVVSLHGETGWLARAYPLTIDGLIYAASMVLLNAARRGLQAPPLAYAALGLGIAATLTANIAAGLAYGPVGAIVAAWPAPALVISYELLMLVIRSAASPVPGVPVQVPSLNGYGPEAERVFAADLAAGKVPGIRRIRSALHVGQDRAQQVQAYLADVAAGTAEHSPASDAASGGAPEPAGQHTPMSPNRTARGGR
jgi:hypothetical protein